MTIEECYVKMGANYQDVIKRLPSAKMIEKFALKFKDDTSFQELETALNEKQGKRQVICWIENHFKKIDNYIEN